MSEAVTVPEVLPRPCLQSAGIAAAALWLPCLVALGIVQGSSHALSTFWMCLVGMPGMIVPVLLQLDDFAFGATAVAVTLLAYASLYLVVRRAPLITMRVVVGAVALLVGLEAMGIGHALRA